jgi:hypothetical protein
MHIKKFLLITVIGIQLLSCRGNAKSAQVALPRNLNEAIEFLEKDWGDAEKLKFKNTPEIKAVTSIHFSTGLWIRNNWIRGDRDTALVKYFHNLGVYVPDNISSIILTSFHRKLNHKNLDLNGQIQPVKAYWKKITECESQSEKLATSNYKKYSVGSAITILMVVDTSGNQRNAVVYECPNPDWKFNAKKDLIINGIVTGKYFINSTSNTFFKVKISKMNFPNTAIFMKAVKAGDVEDFSLSHLVIK